MTRARPHAITQTDQYLALLLDEFEAQGEVLRRILDRLPEPVRGEQKPVLTPQQPRAAIGEGKGGSVEVTEPARPSAPAHAQPVTEPAPSARPAKARPVTEPAPKRDRRRDDTDDDTSVPPPPPRSGKGSGLEAWRSFANIARVPHPKGASRDDIIAACVHAHVIDAE